MDVPDLRQIQCCHERIVHVGELGQLVPALYEDLSGACDSSEITSPGALRVPLKIRRR